MPTDKLHTISGTGDEMEASIAEYTRLRKRIAEIQRDMHDHYVSLGYTEDQAVELVKDIPREILRDLS